MGKLRQCDAQINCDGATTQDPGGDGWTSVFAGVLRVDEQGDGVETQELAPGMVAVAGAADTSQDDIDLCPACAGEVRASHVTSAFVDWLREFEEATQDG